MTTADNRIAYDDPFEDDVDGLPSYPLQTGAEEKGKEGDKQPLIPAEGKHFASNGPLTVDAFSCQVSLLADSLHTLHAHLDALPQLITSVHSLYPADNSVTAQGALYELGVETDSVAALLVSAPADLRTLASKLPVLKPAAGKFLISSAELSPLKAQLASLAEKCKAAHIKATGAGLDEAGQMAALLSAEREGQYPVDQLKLGSYGWRWSIERPYSRLQKALSSVGDLTFLDAIKAPQVVALPSWNPLAYVPSFTSSSASTRPPRYAPAGELFQTVDGSAGHIEEEDKVGSYGEPLERPVPTRPKRRAVVLGTLLLLLVIGGLVAGLVIWTTKHHEATASGGDAPASSAAVNAMPVGGMGW
ncbi:hypothetical protein JCM10207_004937 [Rhodosporidiobolus poonsookiae]